MKLETTQLEKEISAVRTVLDVSKLIIKNNNGDEKEKAKLISVLENTYSAYVSRLVSRSAMEVAIRSVKDDGVRNRIAKEVVYHIDQITALLKEKKII